MNESPTKNVVIGFFLIFLAGVLVVGFWKIQAMSMKPRFIEALKNGQVGGIPIDLWQKTWADDELKTVIVTRLDDSSLPERVPLEQVNAGFDYTINGSKYSYQATIVDSATNIRYIFGCLRRGNTGWVFVSIHPDSVSQRIQNLNP